MGKNGEYFVAKKNEEGLSLEPSSEKVFAREVTPYGLDFTFGDFNGKNYNANWGYLSGGYIKEKKEGKLKENEDFGRVNMDRTIQGLEKEVQDAGADFVLVSNLNSREQHTGWRISGRAQLLIKR